ncbi:hypothetical protein FACS1894201_02650 [Bacteroidia bacterium]|nr:hypothetical protein FACS1894201_02650 [Bacteroidia bacterium]
MKKIHKLVVKAFLGPLIVTFAISMLVLLMQFLWKYVDDLMGKGLDLVIVINFLYYATLTLVPMALPLTVLLASLMTFGNLGERYELVAAKAAGISLQKMMRPLVLFVIGIAVVSFIFANNVYPYAFKKYRTMLHDIQTKKPALNINEGEYYTQLDGYVLRVGKKDSDGKTVHDIQIYDHTENLGNVRMSIAKDGCMQMSKDGQYLVFTLWDGYSYTEDLKEVQNRAKRPFSRVRFEEQKIKFDLSEFQFQESDDALFSNHYKMMTIASLQRQIDTFCLYYERRATEITRLLTSRYNFYSLYYHDTTERKVSDKVVFNMDTNTIIASHAFEGANNLRNDIQYYSSDLNARRTSIDIFEIEWHRKYSIPFTCLVLFLVGAPLGAIIRKGGFGMPVVVSILLFTAFYVLSIICEKSIITTDLSPWRGMWTSAIVFLPIGLFLMIKATTDAAFMDAEVWKRWFGNMFHRQ